MISRISLVAFLFPFFCASQTFNGRIIDKMTQQPIETAAVYFDNTTIGTTTNENGEFEITYTDAIQSVLVVSFLGYERLKINKPTKDRLKLIELIPKAVDLDTVIIETDPWTRERKENYFKRYFLGRNSMANDCRILNIEDIDLRFSPSRGILYSSSEKPILIENKKLGYHIKIDLDVFDFTFKKLNTENTEFSVAPTWIKKEIGTFYRELNPIKKVSKRRLKLRDETYEVSALRFYRSIVNETLIENGYKLYYEDKEMAPKDHFRVNKEGNFFSLAIKHKLYAIEDKFGNKTLVAPNQQVFTINSSGLLLDENGNASKKGPFAYRGFFTVLGISMRLPNDYQCLSCSK